MERAAAELTGSHWRTRMTHQIDELIRRISELDEDLALEFLKKGEAFHFIIDNKRICFANLYTETQKPTARGCNLYALN
jgi:hypothetical protein